MPIRPENLARYPKDWARIAADIRERAQHRCEWRDPDGRRCGCEQYALGRWVQLVDGYWLWRPIVGNTPSRTPFDRAAWMAGEGRHPDGERWAFRDASAFRGYWHWDDPQPVIIVLTVAHLNHQPEDCRPENLAAWCQRHHLAYDHVHHQTNAQATRRARVGQTELF